MQSASSMAVAGEVDVNTGGFFKKEPCQSQEGDYFEQVQSDVYKMDSEPRGLCIIINNMFDETVKVSDDNVLTKRTASDKDKNSLIKIFSWLKFTVKDYDNVSKEYMETILELHTKDEKNSLYDCFVCCVLSHGYEKGVFCNDGGEMDFAQLRSFFTNTTEKGQYFCGKPKLFIIQACQGTDKAKGILVKDSPVIPSSSSGEEPAINHSPIQDESIGVEIEEKIDMDVDRVDNNAQSRPLPPHQIASDADFSFFVATTPGNVFFKCCFF